MLPEKEENEKGRIKTVKNYGTYEEVLHLTMTGKIRTTKQIPVEYQTNEMLLAIKLK